MAAVDLIVSAAWIVPVVPRGQLLENHALAVDKGRIVAIGESSQIEADYQAEERVRLDEHLLIPGLVNCHGHAAMTLLRGYADDYPLQTWLEDYIWPTEGKWMSEAFVRDGTRLAMAEMLRGGTTCFSDMYFFPDVVADCVETAGMRAQICAPIFDMPSAWGSDADDYIAKAVSLAKNKSGSEQCSIVLGPHAPYSVSDESMTKVADAARSHDLGIHIHTHETAKEIEDSLAQYGVRPLRRLDDFAILGPKTVCAHGVHLNDEDIELLLERHSSVAHCPESNLKLASGFCQTDRLLKAGVNVAIGTDGAASNNNLDLLAEMHLAAIMAKAVAKDAAAVPAFQALEMATINGAKAIGMDANIGSLEVGKAADMAAVRFDQLESRPLYHPVSTLVYTCSSRNVTDVWVGGSALLRDRALLSLDSESLIASADEWRRRIHPA